MKSMTGRAAALWMLMTAWVAPGCGGRLSRRRPLMVVFVLIASLFVAAGPGSTASAADTITTFDVPGSTRTEVQAMNNAGDVAGYYHHTDGIRGFVRSSNGTFTSVDGPGATHTYVEAMNDGGDVAGFYDDGSSHHGFVRSADGTFTTFDGPGTAVTSASAMNNGGDVAGSYSDASGTHGFVRSADGTFTTFDGPNLTSTSVYAMNDGGDAAGRYDDASGTHGFVRSSDGTFTTFDGPGAIHTEVLEMNDGGDAAGFYGVASGTAHGFIRSSDGTLTTVDVPGSTYTLVSAMNNGGDAGGNYRDASGTHGFIRSSDGTFTTIDVAGSTYTQVLAMNDGGDAAGRYDDGSGLHGFVTSAADEGIVGTVTRKETGLPEADIEVDLFEQAANGSRGRFLGKATTNSNGRYRHDAEPGCYVLTFIAPVGNHFLNHRTAPGYRYLNQPVCVSEEDQPQAVDVTVLADASVNASISGQVAFDGGTPVDGVSVNLFLAVDGSDRIPYWPGQYLGNARTDDDGVYRHDVAAGCYVLTFIAPFGDVFSNGSRYLRRFVCVGDAEQLDDIDVNVDAPSITVDGSCSLADAIEAANTDDEVGGCPAGSEADTIILAVDVSLTEPLPKVIHSLITIEGAGHVIERAETAPEFRLFEVEEAILDLNNVTLANGAADRVAFGDVGAGGAILARFGSLSITDSTIRDNSARFGGAISLVDVNLTVTRSTITGNDAATDGGGIHVRTTGSGLSGISVIDSTLSNNRAVTGGAISAGGNAGVDIVNSTISGNGSPPDVEGSRGGGLALFRNRGTISHTTIANNTAQVAGGIWVPEPDPNASPNVDEPMRPTLIGVILDNPVGGNCDPLSYPLVSGGHNLVAGLNNCGLDEPSDLVDATADLGPLQDNGGPTATHALGAASTGLDAIPASDCTVTTDQRGISRPQAAGCDIGAYEASPDL